MNEEETRKWFRTWLKSAVASGQLNIPAEKLDEMIASTTFKPFPRWLYVSRSKDSGPAGHQAVSEP
jgi:capsid protein